MATSRRAARLLMLTMVFVALGGFLTMAGESKCYCVSAPDNASVCLGSSVTFQVTANGEGPLTYQWYHGSEPLRNDQRISGATGAELRISGVESRDAGGYKVVVTGPGGGVTSSAATLTVRALTAISDQPDPVALCAKATVTFSVTATGEGTLTYQWYHGPTPLIDGERVSGATTSQLRITDVESGDAGDYAVTVTGECGAVTSDPAPLTVKAPTVISDQPDPLSLCPGASAVFSVVAMGEGTLVYQWHRGAVPLTNGGRVSGATTSQLTIRDVESADAGDYSATVTGECGAMTSSAATLTVKAPTVITDQPDALEVYVGADVTFTVTATGEGPLTYQWIRGSAPLTDGGRVSGATTSRLTINDVESGDAGEYTVAVAGDCGAVTSAVATLSVRPALGKLEIVLSTGLPKDILVVLDITGSMEEPVQGGKKIDLAKAALRQFLSKVPAEMKVGLRTFHYCSQSVLEVPIQPTSTGKVLAAVDGLKTGGTTPLAYALRQIPGDLQGLEGPHVIVFITDGAETCEGDPLLAAKELATSDLNIIFRLVGFDLASAGKQAQAQVQAIAQAARGLYVDVANGDQLLSALGMILPPAYSVFDSTGKLVKEGIVGEAPFDLPAGTYSVVVTGDSKELLRKDITVRLHETVTVTVPN